MKKIFLLLLVVFLASPMALQASVILSPNSTWEYTFTDPTGDATWNTTTGGWTTGPAPFGNNTGGYGSVDPTGLFDYATLWAADGRDGYDLWVRTSIDLTSYDLTSIAWDLGVDNGFYLFANGGSVASANAEGYTWQWEYSGDFSGVSLNQGLNVIAVALEDHGGLTAFDMQITGNSIPEPATMLLLGTGFLGLAVFGRKRFLKK